MELIWTLIQTNWLDRKRWGGSRGGIWRKCAPSLEFGSVKGFFLIFMGSGYNSLKKKSCVTLLSVLSATIHFSFMEISDLTEELRHGFVWVICLSRYVTLG